MLKKISRFLIVAMIQLSVLVLALFFLAPYLLDSMKNIVNMADTLNNTRVLSCLIRVLAYAVIFFVWPYASKKMIQNPTNEIMRQMNQARFIFVGALLVIEILYWVGQL